MELCSLQPENQEKETRCGAIVGINHDGDLDITRGVIAPAAATSFFGAALLATSRQLSPV
jgi:hypothetical protein